MGLSDTACKNAKPKDKPYKKADSKGLYLHVMPTGAKYWRFKYRFHNKEKVLALGVYPEVTLAEAHEKRDAARKLLASGVDPSLEKQKQRQMAALSAETTFEVIAREWHEYNKSRWTLRHAEAILHRLENDIFRVLGSTAS